MTSNQISKQAATMVQGWLANHNGDTESLARWMAYSLKVAGIKDCRTMIEAAKASIAN